MKARAPQDRMAFYLSIERVAPQVWADLRDLSAQRRAQGARVSRGDVTAFLTRWGLDHACEWLADDVLVETRSEPVGVPATDGFYPTHDEVVRFSWEPGESGEDCGAFRRRAKDELEKYIARVEAWMGDRNIELPPREHDRGEAPDGVHRWDMLVSKLVLGWTDERIGAELGISKQAAGKHLHNLAARLGITLPVRQLRKKP
jgi:hypothetical protein